LSVHLSHPVFSPELPEPKATTRRANPGFYVRRGKRLLDIALSSFALLLTLPLLALVAAAVKLSSPGPALFRQERVGKFGRPFYVLKFRSMYINSEKLGPQVTSSSDLRVTRVGALLRGSKLDELPQLWNVLKGDMSVVGPRPELPRYVKLYTAEQRTVLSVPPGITSPASLKYRHEEELLDRQSDPEQFYIECLMVQKLAIDQRYATGLCLKTDLRVILSTVISMLRTRPDSDEGNRKLRS